jgi:hypothetical protein
VVDEVGDEVDDPAAIADVVLTEAARQRVRPGKRIDTTPKRRR